MDLAKIRKKAQLSQNAHPLAGGSESYMAEISQAVQNGVDPLLFEETPNPAEFSLDELWMKASKHHPVLTDKAADLRTPLDRILDGRSEAGCDGLHQAGQCDQIQAADTAFEEFLCFNISDETYGINIMQIKEIIIPRLVTEVPRAPLFVCGVISLRGVIIPVLNMIERLGLNPSLSTSKQRVIVVTPNNGSAYSGLLVDQVTHVARIAASSIEPAPVTLDGLDRGFVKGIGRSDNRLFIILNVESVVDIQLV